jgi:hypothetical protein
MSCSNNAAQCFTLSISCLLCLIISSVVPRSRLARVALFSFSCDPRYVNPTK